MTNTNGAIADITCGMGLPKPNSNPPEVVPVAVWASDTKTTYEIFPINTFYIAHGSAFQVGQLCKVLALTDAVEVDFSGQGAKTVATVIEDEFGNYTVTFDFPHSKKEKEEAKKGKNGTYAK
jgi:hypothetical protein